MLIILEGPDGAGKTTLANRLADHIASFQLGHIELLHKGPPTSRSGLDEYILPLADYRPGANRHVICDRWHLGELVYPGLPGVDRRSLFQGDDISFRYVEMFLASRGAVVVHVDADHSTLLARLGEREDTLDYEHEVELQRARFQRVLQRSSLMKIGNRHVTVDRIIAEAIGQDYAAMHLLELNLTYAGSTERPAYLLVGDVRGTLQPRYPTAFVPLPGTSGRYLLEALPDHWVKFGMFAVANANEGDIGELWRKLHRPLIVVLGREAQHTLNGSLQYGVVPHPQYVRRFHHHHRQRYGELIAQVAESREDMSKWRP